MVPELLDAGVDASDEVTTRIFSPVMPARPSSVRSEVLPSSRTLDVSSRKGSGRWVNVAFVVAGIVLGTGTGLRQRARVAMAATQAAVAPIESQDPTPVAQPPTALVSSGGGVTPVTAFSALPRLSVVPLSTVHPANAKVSKARRMPPRNGRNPFPSS